MELHEDSVKRWIAIEGKKVFDPRFLGRNIPSPQSGEGLEQYCRAALFLLYGEEFRLISDPNSFRDRASVSPKGIDLDLNAIESPSCDKEVLFFVEDCNGIPYRIIATPPIPAPEEFRMRFSVLPTSAGNGAHENDESTISPR